MDDFSVPSGNRRRFLLGFGSAICTLLFDAVARATAPPTETGLSFEGLLKGKPGFQPRTPAPLPFRSIPSFLSEHQIGAIYRRYRQAFEQLQAVETSLRGASRAPANAAHYAELRAAQLSAANFVLLHEFYLRNLALHKSSPSHYVMANLQEHMGSFESWREDFAACARVARAWAVLVYDPYDDRWHNVPLNEDNAGGWVGANPLLVCAVYPQAYDTDYPSRDQYLTAFFEHIDWNAVGRRYHMVDRH
jgi:Fe-Mn family superoxide dismutase